MRDMKTICVILRGSDAWDLERDLHAGAAISDAVDRFNHSHRREAVHGSSGVMGWVIGADTTESAAVYVVQENDGEKVTSTTGTKASLDALVNVLRGHGYTCIKRGGA